MNVSGVVFGARVTFRVSLTALPFHVYGADVNGAEPAIEPEPLRAPESAGQDVEVTPSRRLTSARE